MQGTIQLRLGHGTAQLADSTPHLLIGRDEQSVNLVTPDPSVSRRHCEVFLQHGSAFIRDLGSSNGTWVDGTPVSTQPVALRPGQQIFVGHVPLLVEWAGGPQQGATVMGALPAELLALMNQRKAQAAVQYSTPSAAPATLQAGPTQGPSAAQLSYRRQGSNNNGVLLIALPGDTFTNDSTLEGFLEFTATDAETVLEITVDLVEVHRKGAKKGHSWDRVIVKKGPWKCRKGDVVPCPFSLRIPSATSISDKDVHWEIRGYVDINWAYDIEVEVPITMRNKDVEKIRDCLGALDFRVVDLQSKPLGEEFRGKFHPPAQLAKRVGIDAINVTLQYLGTNMKIFLEVDKTGMFSKDKRTDFVIELERLRAAAPHELSTLLGANINRLMSLT
ncbi:MAG: FHA domain-containing protein [Myxococcales bacterium]|nr:FHA domain-containing protein [Myxococcales bacterium]MCB9717717.1 FHA domain-containing protein [Myxococcales bacterium]